MKLYKDLPKEVVMNAPEGVMWAREGAAGFTYYKLKSDAVNFYWEGLGWQTSAHNIFSLQQMEQIVPLPNIEIPWEATEDSECPVPDGGKAWLKLESGASCIFDAPEEFTWNDNTRVKITSYRIIDEEYMKSEQTTAPVKLKEFPSISTDTEDFLFIRDELPCGNPLITVSFPTKTEQLRTQLTSKLDFLQILGEKYPEIKDKVVELMQVELDAWWHEEAEMEEENH